MRLCKDPATTYLQNLGYNIVRYPREGIYPLDLIGQQNGSVGQLGGIDRLITNAPKKKPKVIEGEAASAIKGKASSKLSVGIGINVLKNLLAALGADLAVAGHYKDARTLQFVFSDVEIARVKPLDVGEYLRDGELNAENKILQQYVLGRGELFLLTSTLRSNRFTVSAERRDGAAVELKVPDIQAIVGGEVKVSTDSERSSTVTYRGPKLLTFGFMCYRVGVADGDLSLVQVEPGGIAMEAARDSVEIQPAVIAPHGLLDLESWEAVEGELGGARA